MAAFIVLWCAVGMIGALVLGALTPWLTNPVIKVWAESAHLETSLGLILLLAVPVIGVVGIVLSSIGFHRANYQGGYPRRLALGSLVCNCAVTLLGLPLCWFLLSIISNVRSW